MNRHYYPRHAQTRRWRPSARALAAGAVVLGTGLVIADPGSSAYAGSGDISITASADTYASTREADLPHGGRSYVYATTDETTGRLRFPTRGAVPQGTTVSSLHLRLYVLRNDKPEGSPVVETSSDDWDENSMTLHGQPAHTFKDVSQWVTAPAGQWVDIPLDASVLNRDGNTDFEVKYSEWYSNFEFSSREGANAPQLVISTGAAQDPSPNVQVAPPTQASDAGYSSNQFDDEFDDAASIDLTGTGKAGAKWYVDRPFADPLPGRDVNVANGVLSLTQESETGNVGLSSVSSKTGSGQSFQYGYYETRLKYDENDSRNSAGYPSFWMIPRSNVYGSSLYSYPELDVFEAYHENFAAPYHWFVGSVHDWIKTSPVTHRMNTGNNIYKIDPSVDLSQWHTYGVLWQKGKLTWYFDGKSVLTQAYGANVAPSPNWVGLPAGTFSDLDSQTQGMALILGTGANYPMQVDWVRVWH